MKNKKFLALLLVLAIVVSALTFSLIACDKEDPAPADDTPAAKIVRISTTTSVNDSGLMAYLQPYFKADTGYDWEIASAGTGAAINSAKAGNADVILVHSKSQEETFVTGGFARKVDGYTAERISFMYNFFVLVGPTATDPAGVKTLANTDGKTVKDAFASIASTESKFISRGDKSGTHTAELKLWNTDLGLTNDVAGTDSKVNDCAKYDWYVSAGQGMGACLSMANEQNAYILTDKATFLSYKNKADGDAVPNLSILWEEDSNMKNTYSMLAVNPNAKFVSTTDGAELPAGTVSIDTTAADTFINWMTSEHAKALIAFYGTTSYGENLFTLQGGYKA